MTRPAPRPGEAAGLPVEPVDRLVGPLARFLHVEAASGILLLAATLLALALANSGASETYLGVWKTPVGFTIGPFAMTHPLKHWIDDGLMAIFFFVIGLEVKRELVLGELRDLRAGALPIAAALGGMIAPAGLYLAMQGGGAAARGWGIPMATDIAFVVGCLAVLGRRVPHGLRVLLLSLAIADDIGAILVIAIGYSSDLNLAALAAGLAGFGVVALLARIGVRNLPAYLLAGALTWFAFHESGVHATIAGVVLGLMTPARSWVQTGRLQAIVDRFAGSLQAEEPRLDKDVVRSVEQAARESLSPLERLESALHPWVSFVIMPVFALANAGVPFGLADLRDPVAVAVITGLVAGKPMGITAFSWIAVRAGLARLPAGVGWNVLAAGGALAGIGFTMALFIAGLALDGAALQAAKVGVLCASAIAALLGMALLFVLLRSSEGGRAPEGAGGAR